MQNPRLATRYAKSIVDLASEQQQLDAVCTDMRLILQVCKSNPDFLAVLRSPVIHADKKQKILEAVIGSRIGKLTGAFITLLVKKGREANLPEIAGSFIGQFNTIRGIRRVKITTAAPISDELRNTMVEKVKSGTGQTIDLESVVDEDIIGGFLLETEGRLVDASIIRDLKDIRKQFENNDYIHKIR